MDKLTVSYTLLKDKSLEMHKHKESFDAMRTAAEKTVHNLSEAWNSNAQEEFRKKFDGLKSVFDNFSKMLDDYSIFLGKICNSL